MNEDAKERAKDNLALMFDQVCSVLAISKVELYELVNEVLTGEVVKDDDILH